MRNENNRIIVHIDSPQEYPRAIEFVVAGWVASDYDIGEITIGGNRAELIVRPDVVKAHPDKTYVTGFNVLMDESSIFDQSITIDVGSYSHRHPLKVNTMLEKSKHEKFVKFNRLFPDDDAELLVQKARKLKIENESSIKATMVKEILARELTKIDAKAFSDLSDDLMNKYNIVENPTPASRAHDPLALALIGKFSNGVLLDCGAGFPLINYSNVVNFEIQNYSNTDVVGVGEQLPFKDDSFDVVFSLSVLEHVKDPFLCASEIQRVLKPEGILYASVPFLQGVHAYPHHYYNMSAQGLSNLFPGIDIIADGVPISGHPIFALNWIAREWMAGLSEANRERFENLSIKEIAQQPESLIAEEICTELAPSAERNIACTNMILGKNLN